MLDETIQMFRLGSVKNRYNTPLAAAKEGPARLLQVAPAICTGLPKAPPLLVVQTLTL